MARVNPRAIVVTVAFLYLLLYPWRPDIYIPSQIERDRASELLERSWGNLDVLNATRFGDFRPWTAPDGDDDDDNGHGGGGEAAGEEPVGWLNMTGFRKDDGYAWKQLPVIQDRARAQIERALGHPASTALEGALGNVTGLYRNVTGSVKGSWVRLPLEGLTMPTINLSRVAPAMHSASTSWDRNITGPEGTIQFRLGQTDEEETDGVRGVSAEVALQESSAFGGGWEASMHGFHMIEYGSIIMTTQSDKFYGLYALPHLALSETQYGLAQKNLNHSLAKMINKRRDELDSARLVDMSVSAPRCELIVYLQQLITGDPGVALDEIEHDLRFPAGNRPAYTPPLSMSMTLYSPDCGFFITSKGPPDFAPGEASHLLGHKTEITQRIVRNVLLLACLLLAAQLYLLSRQMRLSSTPSRQSKIAVRTLSLLSIGDHFVLMVSSFLIPVADGLLVMLMLALFLALMGGSFLPSKLMLDVFNAQEPERIEAERELARNRPPPTTTTTTPDEPSLPGTPTQDTLPLPVLATTPGTPFATPVPPVGPTSTAPMRQTFGRLYTLNVLSLVGLFFLTALALATLPPAPLYIFTRGLALVYASPWIPQIWRQASRSYSRALSLRFVAGMSVVKLLPLAWLWGSMVSPIGRLFYFAGVSVGEDLLPMTADEPFIGLVALHLWAQFVVLGAVEVLGPRWWIPRSLRSRLGLRDAWDWSDVSSVAPQVDDGEGGAKECAICMNVVEIPASDFATTTAPRPPVIPVAMRSGSVQDTVESIFQRLNEGIQKNVPGRRSYMVTPCKHVFHRECLEGWMGLRLVCPVCREGLPAL